MDFSNCNIGYGITGSFCTFAKTRKEVVQLTEMGANVIPIFSYQAQSCDTRFGSAKEFVEGICEITGNEGIKTMQQAEPIGPNNFLDIMVIAISTNDALGVNFKTIGGLMNMKNIYFVPFGQDNYKSKPNSMIAKMELLPDTIELAMRGKQIQPILVPNI